MEYTVAFSYITATYMVEAMAIANFMRKKLDNRVRVHRCYADERNRRMILV